MAQEIEAKIFPVDKEALEKKLREIGAEKKGDVFFRSISFDFPGFPLDEKSAWVRLRDDGREVTLAFKQRLGVQPKIEGVHTKDAGMEEIEMTVSSYEIAIAFLKKIGMVEKFSQEKKRTTWQKGSTAFDIDDWPRLPTYLEIESDSWENVDAAIIELGFDPAQKMICSATQIYKLQGIRDKDYIKMGFDEWITRDGKRV